MYFYQPTTFLIKLHSADNNILWNIGFQGETIAENIFSLFSFKVVLVFKFKKKLRP